MQDTSLAIETLNDLILINNDRITGYEKAAHQAKDLDPEIKNVFHHMASESRKNVTDLHAEVVALVGIPATGTTTSGKLYRAWMDFKTTFTGTDSHSLLSSCESGEDAAQKAYLSALKHADKLPGTVNTLILTQQQSLKSSHDLIKRYRDNNTFSRS